jgi:hypothetical protein
MTNCSSSIASADENIMQIARLTNVHLCAYIEPVEQLKHTCYSVLSKKHEIPHNFVLYDLFPPRVRRSYSRIKVVVEGMGNCLVFPCRPLRIPGT